jgi:YhcH/YjgK/YiaL family protein
MSLIVSSVSHSDRIEKLHPLFARLFDYVRTHDLLHQPLGRIDIDGDRLFINNSEPTCLTADEQVLEVHRDYIDVHFLLQGEETIGWKDIDDVSNEVKAYDADADCALYDERATGYVTLHPGQFLVAFPEDPHAPIIGTGKIRKAIAKVKVNV